MMILRATRKVLRYLPATGDPVGESDTALGDWYINRLVVHRQPLLLAVSARSLVPVLIRARDVATLPRRFPAIVAERLTRMGISSHLVDAETAAMLPVTVAKTVDRSVLGILVDFAQSVPYFANGTDDRDLRNAESLLADTPCYAGRSFDQVVFPRDKTPELLMARWGSSP